MSKKRYDLIYDGKIQLSLMKESMEDAISFIMNEISGKGKWKHLRGINPKDCKIRQIKIQTIYYDLDGNKIEEDKK